MVIFTEMKNKKKVFCSVEKNNFSWNSKKDFFLFAVFFFCWTFFRKIKLVSIILVWQCKEEDIINGLVVVFFLDFVIKVVRGWAKNDRSAGIRFQGRIYSGKLMGPSLLYISTVKHREMSFQFNALFCST